VSDAQPALEPDFIPIDVAAAASGYSRTSMYRFAAEGRIQLLRRGGKTGVHPDELDRFRRDLTQPFVPGARVINNAGGHRAPPTESRKSRKRRQAG
jgi:hypothetical protein